MELRRHVFRDGDGWRTEIYDTQTETVWSDGWDESRQGSIIRARQNMPKRSVIQKALDWAERHPFLVGAGIGALGGAAVSVSLEDDAEEVAGATLLGMLVGGLLIGGFFWAIREIMNE